jgi:pantoate--beta-alanine ligase
MAETANIITKVEDLRAWVGAARAKGARIALVPTMGALHDGHLALCRLALSAGGRGAPSQFDGGAAADRLIVSIFVNPKQFAPNEDFATYPRPFEADTAMIAGVGAHAIYAPTADAMYKKGFATNITIGGVGQGLEGRARPTHFEGVATVVAKLLLQAQPDIAIFGEKDYQQLLVIRRLVADLDIPVEIRSGPTVRQADGLALSSRNRYLDAHERRIAPRLYQTLQAAAAALTDGATPEEAIAAATATLRQCGFSVNYVALCDEETLAPIDQLERPARLLAAARLGRTRLIDNIAVDPA